MVANLEVGVVVILFTCSFDNVMINADGSPNTEYILKWSLFCLEMIATQAEMDSAKLTPKFRDYCAHKWIDYRACLKNNRPFYWRCRHERHSYGECVFEDSVLRMKEWEREKRLREREMRNAKAAA